MPINVPEYFDNLIRETISAATMERQALKEKDKQDAVASSTAAVSSDDKEKLASGEIDVDSIIEVLNTIRSGRSFKDDETKASLDKYVSKLDAAEKSAMYAFLRGLAQIVTIQVPPPAELDPSNPPAKITMDKKGGQGPAKVTIKPHIINTVMPKETKKTPSSEDTSGPVPIKPSTKKNKLWKCKELK
jgi:hypothetical protein